jgi:antiviral helicase SKI2
MDVVSTWRAVENAQRKLASQSPCLTCPALQTHVALAVKVRDVAEELRHLKSELSNENLALFPDLSARLDVLRALGYISEESNDAVELKGRVACEINTADELLLTEMVMENVFDALDPAECAALLSALVLQQKCEDEVIPPTQALSDALGKTLAIVQRLEDLQTDCMVPMDASWSTEVLNPGLLVVVYEWARGRPFASLMGLTSLEEGIIVRAVTRLDETCREVRNCSRVLGNPELMQKMERVSEVIKRDVIFAQSMYCD